MLSGNALKDKKELEGSGRVSQTNLLVNLSRVKYSNQCCSVTVTHYYLEAQRMFLKPFLKEILLINNKKKLDQKWAEDMKRHFSPARTYRWPIDIRKDAAQYHQENAN